MIFKLCFTEPLETSPEVESMAWRKKGRLSRVSPSFNKSFSALMSHKLDEKPTISFLKMRNKIIWSTPSYYRWENWIPNRFFTHSAITWWQIGCTIQPFYMTQQLKKKNVTTFIFSKVYCELKFSKNEIIFGQLYFLILQNTITKAKV